eukprot:scaffold5086_cov118-Isochrysis_galbana.AAC.4
MLAMAPDPSTRPHPSEGVSSPTQALRGLNPAARSQQAGRVDGRPARRSPGRRPRNGRQGSRRRRGAADGWVG